MINFNRISNEPHDWGVCLNCWHEAYISVVWSTTEKVAMTPYVGTVFDHLYDKRKEVFPPELDTL